MKAGSRAHLDLLGAVWQGRCSVASLCASLQLPEERGLISERRGCGLMKRKDAGLQQPPKLVHPGSGVCAVVGIRHGFAGTLVNL